jgi:hypothetical protein
MYCINCRASDHASWNRACPIYLKKEQEFRQRNPENNLPLFPTDDIRTWSNSPFTRLTEPRNPAALLGHSANNDEGAARHFGQIIFREQTSSQRGGRRSHQSRSSLGRHREKEGYSNSGRRSWADQTAEEGSRSKEKEADAARHNSEPPLFDPISYD